MPIRQRRSGPCRVVAMVCVCCCVSLGLVACGSSSKSATTATTAGASSCPFSGTTAPTHGSGAGVGVITTVTPSVSGCIDSVVAKFSTAMPAWKVAYATGPLVDARTGTKVSVPGAFDLVVTFAGTTYPLLGNSTPVTLSPSGWNHVKGVAVFTGPGGALEFVVGLPTKLSYTTSVAPPPTEFVLAIG